jgi:hypothetical protein
MVATLTCDGDAIGMACATGFTFASQARRCRTGRIEFNRIDMLFWAGLFASGCSPRRLLATQLPSATQTFHVSSALGLSPVSFIVFISARSATVSVAPVGVSPTELPRCNAGMPE